jgi:hypothetical protein
MPPAFTDPTMYGNIIKEEASHYIPRRAVADAFKINPTQR